MEWRPGHYPRLSLKAQDEDDDERSDSGDSRDGHSEDEDAFSVGTQSNSSMAVRIRNARLARDASVGQDLQAALAREEAELADFLDGSGTDNDSDDELTRDMKAKLFGQAPGASRDVAWCGEATPPEAAGLV